MFRVTFSPVVSVAAAAALIAGLLLLGLSIWSRPLVDAANAARAGNLKGALAHYTTVERRFEQLSPVKQILPAVYQASVANQLQLQYHLGQFDAVIEKATVSPSTASIHFWAGCALLARARERETPEELITWLSRADDEFRKALERDPQDWNIKFNYEYTRRLLAELRQQGDDPKEQKLPKLLDENPAPLGPPRRIG
jgi:hypothetical protein